MTMLKIALLQLSPEPNLEAALERGLAACADAAASGADIALFPEVWSNGYAVIDPQVPGAGEKWAEAAVRADSEFVRAFQDAARRFKLAIAITFLETYEPRPRNSVRLFDRQGRLVLAYSKVHLVEHATEAFCSPGDKFSVATLETARGL